MRGRGWRPVIGAWAAVVMMVVLPAGARASLDREARWLPQDPASGLLLFGVDPVASVLAGAAVPGSPDHALPWAGRSLYFTSSANRAAFLADPAQFLPALAGHDPLAIAEGRMALGDPAIAAVIDGRLYYFRSEARRQRALVDPAAIAAARARWPEVAQRFAGH